jgi:signal transduction histidine kinase
MKLQAAPEAPVKPLRVLIFEDQPADAELSLHSLHAAGLAAEADIAMNLESLDRQLREQTYDVILADYGMPDATGMDAFAVTQQRAPNTPFLLVTGSLGDEKAVECLKQGVSDYVLKDHIVRLPTAVQRALQERRLREEHARAEQALLRSEEQLRQRNQELEEQYRRAATASRLKSEFLANMSHELRSPLNGIIGFSEVLVDGKMGLVNEVQRDCLGRILNSSRHLLRLINDVLDLAKIEAGTLTFHPELVSVSHLIAETCDSQAALAAEKRIRMERRIESEIHAVLDPARFKQVLYNYLSNALKFTPEGGQVTISLSSESSNAFRVEVTDTGIGIAEDDLLHLFTDFHQLDSGKNKKFQGAGLGLSLTKRIVEAQGGKVGVTSTLAKGSSFFAVLPRVERRRR